VEGIKEEVVLSPAHALSLIASGEGISFYLEKTVYICPPCFSSFNHWFNWARRVYKYNESMTLFGV